MSNIKKFVGEYAYNTIKNISVDNEAIRKALVTPQNARAVFSELTEFETKSLCFEISNSGTIGQIKETTQEEIKEVFNQAGYNRVIFDDKEAINECKKYYRSGEVICTYNNLQDRMSEYHMIVAIKKDIEKIERSINPNRDDEYGTSILNIQIAKNGSHMSIKNRYNHTVGQPDSTLNNNLDMLYIGLQSMVLGYYGFASINSTKAHYYKIVNIGGVYLKYHTEKNNVYFGAFVLDGVNGARFTDSGKYYITAGTGNEYRNYNYPLVLDFENKKAVDICKSENRINTKTSLITRAISEGILTSANKSEVDTITASFKNAKKELLQINKNALKYIHDAYGYDFTKPYNITGFLGEFTVKNIEKITGSDKGLLLICHGEEIKICEMNHGRFYAKDLKSNYSYNINTFYGQGDFEEARKSGTLAAYVIQQDKQFIGNPKPQERNSYIYRRNATPEIDKSGYNITEVREALMQRLRRYKTDKRAKEAATLDYSQDIARITKSFAELKAEIIVKLTNAETYEEYNKISNVTSYKLVRLVECIETIKRLALNKGFESVEMAQNKINNVKTEITELKIKLL